MELVRQKNVATIITFPLIDADGDAVSASANPDSEIDQWADGAAPDGFADCANEATEIGVTGIYYLSLTQGEMNEDYIYIQIKSDNAKTQHILIRTIIGDPLNQSTSTSGRIIDVETTGEVGLNFDNIKAASGATTLTNITVPIVTTLTGHTNQSGDGYAVVAHVDHGNAKLVRSTTPANKLDVSATGEAGLDFANIKDAAAHTTIDISVNVALATTLAVRTSDSVFTINAGSGVNDAYNNMVLALYDVTGTLWETRKISDYNGGDKTVTVDTAFTFVVAANDIIKIFMNAYAPTVAAGGGATATEVWAHDVSGNVTQGQAGNYQTIIGGRYG